MSLPAVAPSTTAIDFHIQRLVATPTPVGPLLVASDAVTWDLTLSDPTLVSIEVLSGQASPFILTTTCGATVISTPSSHDGRICSRPGTWQVQVDPVAGVAVDITVRFRGHVIDIGGAASSFVITQTSGDDRGCVVPGVCLP